MGDNIVVAIIMDKSNQWTECKVSKKDINNNKLYEKCGFKSNDNFSYICTFNQKSKLIDLYGKYDGNIVSIHKRCIFVGKTENGNPISLTPDDWGTIQHEYELLHQDELSDNDDDINNDDSKYDNIDPELDYEVYDNIELYN